MCSYNVFWLYESSTSLLDHPRSTPPPTPPDFMSPPLKNKSLKPVLCSPWVWGHLLKWDSLTEDHKLGFLGKVFFHLPRLDLHWCDFISVLKTRAEKRELLLRNGPADLSISDLGKNCDNVTQYSTYFWDEKIRRLGDLTWLWCVRHWTVLHWGNILCKKTTKIAIFTGVREQKPMFSVIPDLGDGCH